VSIREGVVEDGIVAIGLDAQMPHAYVCIRTYASAYVSIREGVVEDGIAAIGLDAQMPHAYVCIRTYASCIRMLLRTALLL
jgi:hypothetical protein